MEDVIWSKKEKEVARQAFKRAYESECKNEIRSKTIVKKIKNKSSFTVPMNGENLIKAFDRPRKISRNVLSSPEQEIERILSLFRRKAG